MTQEDKELLLRDLSARLPYRTYVKTTKGIGYVYAINTSQLVELSVANDSEYWSEVFNINEIKPYLLPMSSMTEEEFVYFMGLKGRNLSHHDIRQMMKETFNMPNLMAIVTQLYDYLHKMDWLLSKHFDVRGLIERSLAIAVTEENNPYKK